MYDMYIPIVSYSFISYDPKGALKIVELNEAVGGNHRQAD
jgi:hypothetical protein